jgi:hypothetical protein
VISIVLRSGKSGFEVKPRAEIKKKLSAPRLVNIGK